MHLRRCGIGAALLAAIVGSTWSLTGLPMVADATEFRQDRANVRTTTIGESVEGRPIELITISSDPGSADERAALLIVAGIDATHETGISVARSLADRIATEHAGLLADRTVYIVPLVNPDASARRSRGPIGSYDLRHAPKPIDQDRDRRIDEDGPNDLNGDGYITLMRVRNPGPGSGLTATHVEHEDDPRLLRPADRSKGEIPVYAVMTEGIDEDGDGQVAEDPEGGIDLSRHFPYLWDEFDPVTGDYPLEDPGARALANWMLERPNLVAVLAYGPHDTLSSIPPDGKFDDSRRVPLGIESDDKRTYEKISEAFVEATGLKKAEGRSNEGTLHGWAYAHLGLYSFSTPLWSLPEATVAEDSAGDAASAEQTTPKKRATGELGWLEYADERGEGFVEWTTFDHPQFGEVEIGGFVSGFKVNAPTNDLGGIVDAQAAFIGDLLGMFPVIEVSETSIHDLGNGVYEVSLRISNTGAMPTRPAIAEKTRRWPPITLRPQIDRNLVIAGNPAVQIERLGVGEYIDIAWTVRADQPTLDITVSIAETGQRTVTANLEEGN